MLTTKNHVLLLHKPVYAPTQRCDNAMTEEGSYCWRPPFQLQRQTLSLPFTHDNKFSHCSGLKFEEEEEATHVVHLNIMSSFPRLLGPSAHFISNWHISFSTKPANETAS
ncbi:hypothetical protein H5410_030353 [Solanum commersonii]|uniref:Uncharacterized protein n=1 Tax=Solanum commersonii TaxID=4109 RepID=A0A9J5YGL6_SOLCO|nr:hypothetical protein H5410_030353 [Solanum commersonii]